MSYRASRTKLLEAVKVWKESDLGKHFYRPVSERVEEASYIRAPWLSDTVQESEAESFETPIRSCWMESDAERFGDFAEHLDPDAFEEMIESLGGSEEIAEAILSQLEQNNGNVMILAHEGSTEGFAFGIAEGKLFGAALEVEEEFLDEGLISMYFLAQRVPDPNAPIVPGFPMIESQNKMFETLHTSVILLNTLRENAADADFIAIVEMFNNDLAAAIAELSIDENSLSEAELALVVETFAGAFAGLNEEAVIITQ